MAGRPTAPFCVSGAVLSLGRPWKEDCSSAISNVTIRCNGVGAVEGADRMTRWLNCWEIMDCGREPSGSLVAELGVCPAATDVTHDGMNHGHNGGRICWVVAGTLCDGRLPSGRFGGAVEKRDDAVEKTLSDRSGSPGVR